MNLLFIPKIHSRETNRKLSRRLPNLISCRLPLTPPPEFTQIHRVWTHFQLTAMTVLSSNKNNFKMVILWCTLQRIQVHKHNANMVHNKFTTNALCITFWVLVYQKCILSIIIDGDPDQLVSNQNPHFNPNGKSMFQMKTYHLIDLKSDVHKVRYQAHCKK